jgi:ABC-type oligopeptide transport system ATPase subunit
MNWTPSLILQVLIASFEILRGSVFILEGTTGCGKSSILGAFLSLARSAKIIHSDILMNAGFSVEEIKRKMNQTKEELIQKNQNSNEKSISVLNLDDATATSSISILMDLLFERDNTFSRVASINPSVDISLLQKLFASIGNFQKYIISSPNICFTKSQQESNNIKEEDISLKAYNVSEIPKLYSLYVRSSRPFQDQHIFSLIFN